MTILHALDVLSDGHRIISPEYASEVCQALGQKLPKRLIFKAYSDPIGTYKGRTMYEGCEGLPSVDVLALASTMAEIYGVGDADANIHGRGSRAQCLSDAIKQTIEYARGANLE